MEHRFFLGNPHGEENPTNFSLYSIGTMKSLSKQDKRYKGSLSNPNAKTKPETLMPEMINPRSDANFFSLFCAKMSE